MYKTSFLILFFIASLFAINWTIAISAEAPATALPSYTADSLGNLQLSSTQAEELPPTLLGNSDDSVYRWSDTLYDFIPQRLLNPSEDLSFQRSEHGIAAPSLPPTVLNWNILTDIEYRSEYFEEMEMELYSPMFSDQLKEINGQLVEIAGYVIPVVEDGTEVALSANPYAACFFCGKASPASVMSVMLAKRNRQLRTDDYRTIRGRLKLNYDDPNQFYYILEDAELIRS